jgi:putative flippase GtrA
MWSDKAARQTARFIITGLLTTALHILVAVSVISMIHLFPPTANGIAFVIATVFSYVTNTLWSFSNTITRKNLLRYVLVSMIGCVLSVGISGVAEHFGMHYGYGIALVVFTVPPITFLLHKLWTYR